jgi:hypothetical protein
MKVIGDGTVFLINILFKHNILFILSVKNKLVFT